MVSKEVSKKLGGRDYYRFPKNHQIPRISPTKSPSKAASQAVEQARQGSVERLAEAIRRKVLWIILGEGEMVGWRDRGWGMGDGGCHEYQFPMDPWPLSEKVRLTLQIITQTLPKKVLGSIGIDINWFRGVNHDIMISWIWLNCYIITIVWPLHHHYIKCCWTHGSIFIYTNVVNLLQFNIAIDIMVILNIYCNITIISIAIRYIHYIDI